MTSEAIYTELKALWEQFETAHNGTKKKNKAEARKAIGEIKKLVTSYRAASTEEGKAK